MRRFLQKHKTLAGLVLIAFGVAVFAVAGIMSFDHNGSTRLISPVPILGGLSLLLGFKLVIADEKYGSHRNHGYGQ